MRYIFLLILALLLSGCLSPVRQPVKTYVLTNSTQSYPESYQSLTPTTSQKILFVSPLISSAWLNTSRMAYQQQPDQMAYFAQNVWAATPSELLQPIIIHALQQSHLYRAVIIGPTATRYDQRLDINIVAMQQEFWQKPSVYQVTLQVQLINNLQKVIAATQLNATATAPTDDPQGGVDAANYAIAELMPRLVAFCRQGIHNN